MIHEHPCPGAIPQPRRSGDAPVSADLAAALAVPAGRQGLPAVDRMTRGFPWIDEKRLHDRPIEI